MANTKVTGDLIASSTIATGNIADNAVTSDKISGITTAHITEGSNLYYTDARADARAALLVDSAPSTLNTLNELAAALGDDPNFATTVTNSIATKMPLAGGTFTGNVSVNGEARVYTGSNLGYWGVDAGNSYVYLGTNSSAYGLSLQTGGIDRVNINDAGNVFISTPITNAFYGLSLTYNNTNTADFTVNQATGQIKIGGVAAGYFPTFYSAGTERMRIASTLITYPTVTELRGDVAAKFAIGNMGGASSQMMVSSRGFTTFNVSNTGSALDATERMRISSSGLVQIGASSVTNLSLGANGNDIELSAKKDGTDAINMVFKTQASGGGLSEKMRISSDGNVTIGSSTLTGSRSLTLLSATNATNYDINFQQAGTTNFGRIRFTEGAADFQFIPQVGQGPNLTLQYGGNSFFSRGNVGIGETTPDQKLNVREDGGSDVFRGIEVHNNNISLARAGICFKAYDWVQSAIWHGRSTTAAYGGALVLGTNPDTSDLSVSGVTGRMWILNNGNVGIGETSPGSKLQIKGNGAVSGLTFKTTDSSSNETFYINDGGTVGVRYYPFKIGVPSGTANVANSRFQIATTAGDFVVLNDGKTGIGTQVPSAKLEVVTAVGADAIRLNYGQSADIFLGFNSTNPRVLLQDNSNVVTHNFQSNGDNYIVGSNVGIGTTSPTAKLDVNGTVRYRGSIYNQLAYQAVGNYAANTWHTFATSATLTQNGIYIIVAYIEDFTAGGGNYYTYAASTNFYWSVVGTNRTTAFNFPPMLGTGHATGVIPSIRITQELGTAGALSKLQWQSSYTYTNLQNAGGKILKFDLKRIGA